MLAYGLVLFAAVHHPFFMGHFTWKRGKLPRLQYNDLKYNKFMGERDLRHKLLTTPALEAYPDMNNRLFMKQIKHFTKQHR